MPIDSSKFFDSIRIKPNKLSAKQQAAAREEVRQARELQARRIYASRPTLSAGTEWTSSTDTVFDGTYRHLHRAAKEKTRPSPMELVLIGLCGCTGYDVASILRKKREPFTSLEVRASAERAPEPPTVYTSIKLTYVVGGKVSRKSVEDAVRLSKEKYCSVSAMLEKTAKITSEIELHEG